MPLWRCSLRCAASHDRPANGHAWARTRRRSRGVDVLLETAKLNGLDLEAHLREVPQRIADHPVNRIDELLPWAIAAQQALPRAA